MNNGKQICGIVKAKNDNVERVINEVKDKIQNYYCVKSLLDVEFKLSTIIHPYREYLTIDSITKIARLLDMLDDYIDEVFQENNFEIPTSEKDYENLLYIQKDNHECLAEIINLCYKYDALQLANLIKDSAQQCVYDDKPFYMVVHRDGVLKNEPYEVYHEIFRNIEGE